jgi:tetratricopeptide (TPR) repeat protein
LVTLVGEAGVGKSRLVSELAARVDPGARVVRGACLSYGEGITFWAIAQIVRDLAGIRDDHTAEEARERVAPRIAQVLGLAEGAATADQTALAIAQFLGAAAAERPLVVLLDDVHWAEPALLDLLSGLPAMVDGAPLLLVCVARPELLESRTEWPTDLMLDPLGDTEVDELLERLEAPPATRVRIAAAAAGNPLYAEELVAWVSDGGDLDALPTSLNALLGARLDRLDAEARDALERGAVEGEVFHQGTVVELSEEHSRPAVPGELGELARKDLIRLAAASLVAGEVAYRFKHILVREAAYGATAKRLRAVLHERFADWLERTTGGRVGEYHEILGYHLEQAYRYRVELGPVDDHAERLAARAGGHLGAAGSRAIHRGDARAAANLLGRALALLPADSLERLRLMGPYTHALGESGRALEGRAVADELYERATAIGERGLSTHARLGRAALLRDPNVDVGEARVVVEEAIETFAELGDEVGLGNAKRSRGQVARVLGQEGEAGEWFERALVHANRSGDLVTRRMVTQSLAMALCTGPIPVEAATIRCRQLVEMSGGDRVLEAVTTRCLAALLAMAGRFDDADAQERRSAPLLEQANLLTPSWVTYRIVAEAKELAGDRAGAERELRAQWLSFRDTLGGAPDARAMRAAYDLANFYCDDGRWDDAEACLAPYRDLPEQRWVAPTAYRLAAEARLDAHRGLLDSAVARAGRAVELADTSDMLNMRARIWLARAEVDRAADRAVYAEAAVGKALELYEEKGNVAAAGRVRAAVLSA